MGVPVNSWELHQGQYSETDYRCAQERLIALQRTYVSEKNTRDTMLKLGAWCGGATAVLFVYAGVIPSLIESLSNQLTGIELSIGIVFECVLFVGLCLFAACAPAGVMAMARAIKNSHWFIWGGTAVMVTLLILGVVVPFLIGPFCLVRQIGKVKGLHESIQKLEALLSNNGLND